MSIVASWDEIVCFDKAKQLAEFLSIPCMEYRAVSKTNYVLLITAQRMILQSPILSNGRRSEIYAEFIKGSMGYRQRHGGGRNQAIAKAVGIKPGGTLRVVDATAGLGKDAFILATLGCHVHLIERSPIIAVLLQDGIDRVMQDSFWGKRLEGLLHLSIGDAKEILLNIPNHLHPDVIYLDPMFPKRTKSSLNKIDMRIIRDIVGEDFDTELLLKTALMVAKKRVVVKRPILSESLLKTALSFKILGKRNRFDIYLVKNIT